MLMKRIVSLALVFLPPGLLIAVDGEKPPTAYTGNSKHTINVKAPDIRQQGKWGEWKLWYIFKGARSEGFHGVLMTNDKTISGKTAGEKIKLGGRTWVWHGTWDERKDLFSKSGWLPEDIGTIFPSWKIKAEQAGASDGDKPPN